MNTNEIAHIKAVNCKPFLMEKGHVAAYKKLQKLGICFDERDIHNMVRYAQAMDADLQAPITTASVTTPLQFLQSFLPGFVNIITAALTIDILIGMTVQGRWEDIEIVQGVMEHTGGAVPYGDYTNIPHASWNTNWERRSIVAFEQGMEVGKREEARAAAMAVNSPSEKRLAAAQALEIIRNMVGFYGYNSGANRTYGILNDPNLPAYIDVATGTGGTFWAVKTFLEITADIREWVSALRIQSKNRIDPKRIPLVMGLAMSAIDYLSTTSDQGVSVQDWINKAYPNIRVESIPEFDAANGSENVAYLFAESVDDNSSDDSRTFVQVVPAKFQTVGVQQLAKTYSEDYTNATAGTLLKRPYAVIRRSAI